MKDQRSALSPIARFRQVFSFPTGSRPDLALTALEQDGRMAAVWQTVLDRHLDRGTPLPDMDAISCELEVLSKDNEHAVLYRLIFEILTRISAANAIQSTTEQLQKFNEEHHRLASNADELARYFTPYCGPDHKPKGLNIEVARQWREAKARVKSFRWAATFLRESAAGLSQSCEILPTSQMPDPKRAFAISLAAKITGLIGQPLYPVVETITDILFNGSRDDDSFNKDAIRKLCERARQRSQKRSAS